MVQVKSEFKDFYEEAVRCQDLDRGGSAYNPTWTCRKNGLLCAPGNCPRQPWLRALIIKTEPEAAPEIHEVENEIAEMSSERALERVKPVVSEPSSDQDSEKLVREEPGLRILTRDTAKSKSKPHIKKGHVKRALVTFIEKKTKQLQRWGVDLCFSQTTRRTSILKFRKGRKGDDVRFYFGREVTNRDAERCVGSWFGSLHVHDPQAVVNVMGSSGSYSIDILDES